MKMKRKMMMMKGEEIDCRERIVGVEPKSLRDMYDGQKNQGVVKMESAVAKDRDPPRSETQNRRVPPPGRDKKHPSSAVCTRRVVWWTPIVRSSVDWKDEQVSRGFSPSWCPMAAIINSLGMSTIFVATKKALHI